MNGLRPFRVLPSDVREWSTWCEAQNLESNLGNPSSSGSVLSSDTEGNRSWITVASGNSFDGWDDITADLSSGKPGGTSPTWAAFRNGIYAWRFGASTDEELFINFHIKHDYKYGSSVFPHVHWSPGSSASTGTVRWGMEYTVARGHDQEAFPATTTVYVEQTISTSKQYQHMITEVSNNQAFNAFEPDTLILMRIFRNGSDGNDDFPDPVFAFTADIHFETERAVTPYKSPPFIR